MPKATKSANEVYSDLTLDLLLPDPNPVEVAKEGSERSEDGGDQNLQPTPPTPPTRQDSSDELSLQVFEYLQPTRQGSNVSAESIQSDENNKNSQIKRLPTNNGDGPDNFEIAHNLSGSNRASHPKLKVFGKVFGALNVIGSIIASGVVGVTCESRHYGDRDAVNSCLARDVPTPIGIVVVSSLFCGLGAIAYKKIAEYRISEQKKKEEDQKKFSLPQKEDRRVDVDLEGAVIPKHQPPSIFNPIQSQFFTSTPRPLEVHHIVPVPREEMITRQPDSKTSLRNYEEEGGLEFSEAPRSMRCEITPKNQNSSHTSEHSGARTENTESLRASEHSGAGTENNASLRAQPLVQLNRVIDV
jgi:hypothetical protein